MATPKSVKAATTNTAALMAAGEEFAKSPVTQKIEDVERLLLTPKSDGSFEVFDLERYFKNPLTLAQTVTATTPEGFATYVNTFGDPAASAIFVQEANNLFKGVLDYHRAPDAPTRTKHTVQLTVAYDEAWAAWTDHDGQQKSQIEFAQFLEDHIAQIAEPVGLVELARNIEKTKTVTFKSQVRPENSTFTFGYSDEEVQGSLSLPREFTLVLPVYEGGATVTAKARLRYSITERGKLTLWYDLIDADVIEKAAFAAVKAQITAATKDHVRFVMDGMA